MDGVLFLLFSFMNNNFIERKMQSPRTQSIQERQSPYRLLQSKKVTKSTKFDEEKLGPYTTAQLKKEDFKENMLDSQSPKRR
jgi:hypothetical protein